MSSTVLFVLHGVFVVSGQMVLKALVSNQWLSLSILVYLYRKTIEHSLDMMNLQTHSTKHLLTDAFATVPYHTKGDAFWKDDWRNFHVRASEDSFIQCVSIFAVGFADHFLMESGGDMSITNSNSNFGNTSLHAIGFKGFAFNQDKGGFITDIIPPQTVDESSGNVKRQSYYTLDVYASNDTGNDTKVYHGDEC